MNDQNEFITPNQRRQAVRDERSAKLRRQFLAAVEEHAIEQKALEYMLLRMEFSDEIANLAESYVRWGQFTWRQWRFIIARMEGKSTAT